MSELDDEHKLQRRGTLDNIRRKRELSDVARILSAPEGRRFYWRILERCGVFKSSFTGNNTTFYNEGERNIGLILMGDMNEADPTAYLKMLEESRKDMQKDA